MGQFVRPKVFLSGFTTAYMPGIIDYLKYTNQTDFLRSWSAAEEQGASDGERLCSLYAKLCYASLVPERNENVNRVRDVPDNIRNCFDQGHGSVFENAMINFIATDVSRVFTHELVRMRAGWAYAQTSGRYVRLDKISVINDPILDDCLDLQEEAIQNTERILYLMECRKKLRRAPEKYLSVPMDAFYWSKEGLAAWRERMGIDPDMPLDELRIAVKWVSDKNLKDFTYKKQVTSAIRRYAPNGQANEIGFSVNFRAIRHFLMLRSNRGAEWEIRQVTQQVYELIKDKFPLLLYGHKTEMVNDALEITGMKTQPYELDSRSPEALKLFKTELLENELNLRYGHQ